LSLICVFVIVAHGDHAVKSQIKQCHDRNGNCIGDQHKRETNDFLLSLPRLETVKLGYTQEMELTEGRTHRMTTLSLHPPVFEIPNFFTDEECEMIVELAQEKGLKENPLTQDNDNVIDKDSVEDKLKDWDKNGDGFVDKAEVLHLPGKRNIYLTEEDVLEMFKALDLDQDEDGKVPLKELDHTSLEKIHSYVDKELLTKPRMRNQSSQQVWLWHDDDELLQYEGLLEDYHDRLEKLTKLPKPIIEQSEPVQVVHYTEGGHYHCHHDSEKVANDKACCLYGSKDCRLCRYLTIMVFLNDVEEGGECAFPVADNKTFSWKAWSNESSHKCNMVKHCDESNLLIKPQRGKAVMWYNHRLDSSQTWLGKLDPLSYQGSCAVKKGEKWVAKMWININGDGKSELRAWKMGNNWLAENNRNEEIINALRTQITEEIGSENKYTREKNGFDNEEVKVEVVDNINSNDETSSKEDTDTKDKSVKSDVNHGTLNNKEITGESIKTSPEATPEGPKLIRTETSSPLPLTEEQMTPKGPKVGQLPPQGFEGIRIVQSIMLLLEELDQVELEIIARNLHTKLKLVCVPLIVNPMGRI